MKEHLELWAIEYYGLQRDKEQNTARWRIMQSSVQQMVTFLGQVVASVQQFEMVANFNLPKQVEQ